MATVAIESALYETIIFTSAFIQETFHSEIERHKFFYSLLSLCCALHHKSLCSSNSINGYIAVIDRRRSHYRSNSSSSLPELRRPDMTYRSNIAFKYYSKFFWKNNKFYPKDKDFPKIKNWNSISKLDIKVSETSLL